MNDYFMKFRFEFIDEILYQIIYEVKNSIFIKLHFIWQLKKEIQILFNYCYQKKISMLILNQFSKIFQNKIFAIYFHAILKKKY